MKVLLDLHRDTDNSYLDGLKLGVESSEEDELVTLTLDCPDREIRVDKKELKSALGIL